MNPLTPEITKHLRHFRHRKDYLGRKVAKYANRETASIPLPLLNTLEMHKREIAAIEWVLSQYPSPPPKTRPA